MIDAIHPESPNTPSEKSPESQVMTDAQLRFVGLVDRAAATREAARACVADLEPLSLLSYTSGRMNPESRRAFEARLQVTKAVPVVVATVKAARPAAADAPLGCRLSSRTLRGLSALIAEEPEPSAEAILKNVARSAHRALLDDLDLGADDPRAALDRGDLEAASVNLGRLTGAARALVLGALGRLDEASRQWSELETSGAQSAAAATLAIAAADEPTLAASDDALTQLCQELSDTPRSPRDLLTALISFSHRQQH